MPRRAFIPSALLILMTFSASPALASDGEIVFTHDDVVNGGITPDDDPGYPATLSVPGSYKLGSNLSVDPGLDGIVATAPDITIDLNGFRLSGGPAGGVNNGRIGIVGEGDRLTVKNGGIGGFTSSAIYYPRLYLIAENLRVVNNGSGIVAFNKHVGSDYARILNSTFALNRGPGIACRQFCHIEGNLIATNSTTGIMIISGTILGNTIMGNGQFGIYAYSGQGNFVGYGNNTIANNNAANGNIQVYGSLGKLQPNSCSPVAC